MEGPLLLRLLLLFRRNPPAGVGVVDKGFVLFGVVGAAVGRDDGGSNTVRLLRADRVPFLMGRFHL